MLYYRKYHGQKKWGKVALSDDDIVNLVYLKFISEVTKLTEQVMKMRAKGQHFVDIHDTIQLEKAKTTERTGRGAKIQTGQKGQSKNK
jgi:hypothetical protein